MHTELRAMPLVEIITVGEQPVVDAMTWDQLLEQGRFSAYDRAAVDLSDRNA